MSDQGQVTLLLSKIAAGDPDALDRLVPLVYAELHRMAATYLKREAPGHTLQATALVNEVYLRLVGRQQPGYAGRAHFYGIASRIMRQILVDHARSRMAAKRGGDVCKVPLDEARDSPDDRPDEMLAVDDALQALECHDPEKLRLIELRFFAGLTAEETADLLGLPVNTVRNQLRIAQAWLRREVGTGLPAGIRRA